MYNCNLYNSYRLYKWRLYNNNRRIIHHLLHDVSRISFDRQLRLAMCDTDPLLTPWCHDAMTPWVNGQELWKLDDPRTIRNHAIDWTLGLDAFHWSDWSEEKWDTSDFQGEGVAEFLDERNGCFDCLFLCSWIFLKGGPAGHFWISKFGWFESGADIAT